MPEMIVKLGDKVVQKYFFDKEVMSIGRARDNDIVIENLSVSRNHARVRQSEGKYILTDLNSANGTFVNNVRINKIELQDNDTITIGKHTIQFMNKKLSDEQLITDAFGAERTMIVDRTPAARLIIDKGKQKDQEFRIAKEETYIGRATDNEICLHDWFVSKKHALILRQGQNYFLRDLKSWRGSMLNGKFTREAPLKDGDTLQFGSTVMIFKLSAGPEMLQITGRVPEEIIEEEPPVPAFEPELDIEEIPPSEKIPAMEKAPIEMKEPVEISSEWEEKNRAEEEEVARMQAAWEPLAAEEEKKAAEEAKELEMKSEETPAPAPAVEESAPPKSTTEGIQEDFDIQAEGIEKDKPAVEEEPAAPSEEIALDAETKAKPDESAEPVAEEKEEKPHSRFEQVEIPADLPPGVDPKEVEMWLVALKNPSRIIRKNAATFLKKLTGKDYKYE
ncbi:MAG TPA: FHA domain-containing protein [Candidatus Sumerlaeia bacterium]|nr:FHA domain-containing protein [Candidatus Sumerlaeia bacterium]